MLDQVGAATLQPHVGESFKLTDVGEEMELRLIDFAPHLDETFRITDGDAAHDAPQRQKMYQVGLALVFRHPAAQGL